MTTFGRDAGRKGQMADPAALPSSPACARNREPIAAVLREVFADRRHVLEIGSGTGEHGVYFAGLMPHLTWLPTDLPPQLPMLDARRALSGPENLAPAQVLDLTARQWPEGPVDAAFSANTAHIVPWEAVEAMFRGLGARLPPGAPFCLYGPFHQGGAATSEGNRRFDASLRAAGTGSGIRDVDDLIPLADHCGFVLYRDHDMPANNRLLEWRRGNGCTS